MIEYRPFAEIGGTQTGWLRAKHHFAIGPYGNPEHHPVGNLYVWNDDDIAPHSGFPLHPHADVEIITYVRAGVVSHADSLGNKGRINAGDVQVISAGTGIRHSERNEENVATRMFQIWLHPQELGGNPRWGTKPFPKADRSGRFIALASGRSAEDALPIRADAEVLGAILPTRTTTDYTFDDGDTAYLVVSAGEVTVNGRRAQTGDGLVVLDERSVHIEALADAELVLVVTADGALV